MCNYDFEILQYNEFENLTRDLLQAEFGIFIESFKDGKDGGIDLRFGINEKDKCIVQVKRYKDWTSLKQQLEDEVEKVKRLKPKPKRYILSTSVPLSPANKEAIKTIFTGYIKDTADILGRDDINNLLDKHPDIEKQYYKLWLSSTAVLEDLLHKDVVNWSKFELDTIKEEIKKYVINDSFRRAREMLKENGYVIISGIPGIGKTTLARMLIYQLLASGYEELVCIEDNLRDGARMFQEGKMQVFFFDDFLGSNTFEPGEKGFEGKLLSFINAIKREKKSKLFIMTTREYILTQAKEHYEKFNSNNVVDIAKCTLDLGSYSKHIRANILYNHIAEAHLPQEYIEKLLEDKKYQVLVDHPYFNPRVIEIYIDRGEWKKDTAETFVPSFITMFNNPRCVWERAFRDLPKTAKYALLVLGTIGKEVYEQEWHAAFRYFLSQNELELHLGCSDDEWREIIRILEDCFIKTSLKTGKPLKVEQYNPSVRGFLVEYIRNNADVQMQLIKGAQYVEQLYRIFTTKSIYAHVGDAFVFVSQDIAEVAKERLVRIMVQPKFSCDILENEHGFQTVISKLHVLYRFDMSYGWDEELMEKLISIDELKDEYGEIEERLYFLEHMKPYVPAETIAEVLDYILIEDKEPQHYLVLVETLYKMKMHDVIQDDTFIAALKDNIDSTINYDLGTIDDTQSLTDVVQKLAEYLPEEKFPLGEYLEDINCKEEQILENALDYEWYREGGADVEMGDDRLEEMMTSLRVQEE